MDLIRRFKEEKLVEISSILELRQAFEKGIGADEILRKHYKTRKNQVCDCLGQSVKRGDIMLELDGCFDEETCICTVWEYRKNDGDGWQYSEDGESSDFCWVWANDCLKLDKSKLSDEFLYSFYHGMECVEITNEATLSGLYDILNAQTNRFICKKDVEDTQWLASIKLEDIKWVFDNIDRISAVKMVPRVFMAQVLVLSGIKPATAYNGEIGIASLDDMCNYSAVIETIQKAKEGVMKEKYGGGVGRYEIQ